MLLSSFEDFSVQYTAFIRKKWFPYVFILFSLYLLFRIIIYIFSLLVFIFQIILLKYSFNSSYINFSPTLKIIFQDHISRREKGEFEFGFIFEDYVFCFFLQNSTRWRRQFSSLAPSF